MTHQQMFHAADNADGYVSVIVLRERYFDDLKKLGFVETEAEALSGEIPTSTGDDAKLAELLGKIERLEKENAELNELLTADDKPEGEQKRGPGRPKKADA